jgi:signal transduction histidine kinase
MKRNFRIYSLSILICFSALLGFAAIQYQLVQKAEFDVVNYIIPSLVGITFGVLFARIKTLEIKYHQEKNQVEEKNKQIHMFIGTIVHDLRSPITAVYSILELVRERIDAKEEKTQKLIDVSMSSIESMLENIQLILDNSRLETGKIKKHLEIGNPYYTINSTIDKHIILAINKSISIQRIVDKGLPNVAYDKEMLDRILSNLISNSIKYSPPQTQIKIYSELLSEKLNLVVEDQGQGFSEEDKENLFKEFARLSAKPTGGEASSGLGLAVAKKLVDEMGGSIWCESEGKGKGSKFKLSLPIRTNGA